MCACVRAGGDGTPGRAQDASLDRAIGNKIRCSSHASHCRLLASRRVLVRVGHIKSPYGLRSNGQENYDLNSHTRLDYQMECSEFE